MTTAVYFLVNKNTLLLFLQMNAILCWFMLEQLLNNKKIIAAERYVFDDFLKSISDQTVYKNFKKLIDANDIYRFIYRVNNLNVVGYISAPKKLNYNPCLIHLRGGTGEFGKLTARGVLKNLVEFSEKGYVVISTQYPGVEGGEGKDTFGGGDDIASVLELKKILNTIPGINSKSIGVKGHSRGGLMAYLLLSKVKWVNAAVIIGGPTNQIRQGKERDGWRAHQISLWGKSKEETINRSPIFWVNKISKKTPILIIHGSADWRVNPLDSIEICANFVKEKVPHKFILYEGADHSISEFKNESFSEILSWLDRYVKEDSKLPNLEPHGE
jgi:dipeptidyl aminopeptidase/acylaminoacyl peptidase